MGAVHLCPADPGLVAVAIAAQVSSQRVELFIREQMVQSWVIERPQTQKPTMRNRRGHRHACHERAMPRKSRNVVVRKPVIVTDVTTPTAASTLLNNQAVAVLTPTMSSVRVDSLSVVRSSRE